MGSIVYAIGFGEYVKVGVTSNLRQRLRWLQTGCPFDLEVIGYKETDADDERAIHRRFANERIRGEWFRLDAGQVDWLRRELPMRGSTAVAAPGTNTEGLRVLDDLVNIGEAMAEIDRLMIRRTILFIEGRECGLTNKEMADVSGLTETAVSKALVRARLRSA